MELTLAAPATFGFTEVRQHLRETPTGQPHPRPLVVVRPITARIHHPVDGGAAAENLAARRRNAPVVGVRLGLGHESPADARRAHRFEPTQRHIDQGALVGAARFQQEDAIRRILAQARGQHATRGARAHDDVIESRHLPGAERTRPHPEAPLRPASNLLCEQTDHFRGEPGGIGLGRRVLLPCADLQRALVNQLAELVTPAHVAREDRFPFRRLSPGTAPTSSCTSYEPMSKG